MKEKEQTSVSRRGKIIRTVIIIILAVLLAANLLISNYLVSYAIGRRTSGGADVVPTPTTTDATKLLVEENTKRINEATEEWYDTITPETVHISSADGLDLVGDIVMTEEPSDRWVILVHGYTARRIYMYSYAMIYSQRGYNVLLPDMRAHGDSEGDYIGMGWLDRKDMLLWTDLICERNSDAEIILHGVSMGGATVMMTSGEELPENVVAVVDDCGYTSVWDIFSDELEYLFGLPDFPFLYTANVISKMRAGYTFTEASAIEQITKTKLPVLFIHGSEDNFVHTDMVYELYDACPTEKDMMIVENAGHGQAYYYDPEGYEEKIFEFIEK